MRAARGVSTNMSSYRAVMDAHCRSGDWASAQGLLEDARRDQLKPGTGDLRAMVEVRREVGSRGAAGEGRVNQTDLIVSGLLVGCHAYVCTQCRQRLNGTSSPPIKPGQRTSCSDCHGAINRRPVRQAGRKKSVGWHRHDTLSPSTRFCPGCSEFDTAVCGLCFLRHTCHLACPCLEDFVVAGLGVGGGRGQRPLRDAELFLLLCRCDWRLHRHRRQARGCST